MLSDEDDPSCFCSVSACFSSGFLSILHFVNDEIGHRRQGKQEVLHHETLLYQCLQDADAWGTPLEAFCFGCTKSACIRFVEDVEVHDDSLFTKFTYCALSPSFTLFHTLL